MIARKILWDNKIQQIIRKQDMWEETNIRNCNVKIKTQLWGSKN